MSRMGKKMRKEPRIASAQGAVPTKKERNMTDTGNETKLCYIKVHSFIDDAGIGVGKVAMSRITNNNIKTRVTCNFYDTNSLIDLELLELSENMEELLEGYFIYIETINQSMLNLLARNSTDGYGNIDSQTKNKALALANYLSSKYEWRVGMGNVNDLFMQDKSITLDDCSRDSDLIRSIALCPSTLLYEK